MSPSSPGVPGGEPEPAHPHQQRLGAVSDPVVPAIPSRPPHGAAGAVHHPAPLAWPGTWQEQGLVVLGLPGSVPVSAAPSGSSPSLCLSLAVSGGLAAAGFASGAVRGPRPRDVSVGTVSVRGDRVPGRHVPREMGCWGHRGLLAPRPPSADTAASIPSWLFIFRIPWQGRDCKQLIFSRGHLHPMAVPRSHRGVAGCPVPPGDVAPRCCGTVGPHFWGLGGLLRAPGLSPAMSPGPCSCRRRCAVSSWRRGQGQWRRTPMLW